VSANGGRHAHADYIDRKNLVRTCALQLPGALSEKDSASSGTDFLPIMCRPWLAISAKRVCQILTRRSYRRWTACDEEPFHDTVNGHPTALIAETATRRRCYRANDTDPLGSIARLFSSVSTSIAIMLTMGGVPSGMDFSYITCWPWLAVSAKRALSIGNRETLPPGRRMRR
jgi:hypothetical protein